MFNGVDHVVIAVKDLDAAVGRYETIYGTGVSDRSDAPAAGMAMAFFRFGDSYIELVSTPFTRAYDLVGDPGPGNPVKGQVFVHPSVTGGVLTQLVQR
jgi:catechol 2,3-dioxygenase-like lactoylglutathione lyase family enzyme